MANKSTISIDELPPDWKETIAERMQQSTYAARRIRLMGKLLAGGMDEELASKTAAAEMWDEDDSKYMRKNPVQNSVSRETDVLWAASNCLRKGLKERDAPSALAWVLYKTASDDEKFRQDILRTCVSKALPNKAQVEDGRRRADDGRANGVLDDFPDADGVPVSLLPQGAEGDEGEPGLSAQSA